MDFHERYPLEGYRRLTFMMLDEDIVAVKPATTYRFLKAAGAVALNQTRVPEVAGLGYIPGGGQVCPGNDGAPWGPVSIGHLQKAL